MEKIRLLLVDDEERFRDVIARRLSKRGLLPKEAKTGEECLAILEKEPMDVVVLDIKMPGMDGLEVLRHVKEKYKKTEVILLTGHASTQDGVYGIKSGAFDYLTKPVEVEHLASKIRQAYEKALRKEEKEREARFRAMMKQRMIGAQRLASLGTLAAGVAHEINNPLAIINDSAGWMRLLLEKKELADAPFRDHFQKGLDKIEKSVERAKKITHQLLSFVRKSDSVLREVDLSELVEEVIQLIIKEAKHKEIEIARKTEPSLGKIWSDPYQLRQVLINLLTNAIHATPPKGKISIDLQSTGEEVVLSVRDTGGGIPEENVERIFEPFFSTKSSGEGTGLGLFVTRSIVEKLGGKIEVESGPGQGTSFKVTLPKAYEIKADARQTVPAEWIGNAGDVMGTPTSSGEDLP